MNDLVDAITDDTPPEVVLDILEELEAPLLRDYLERSMKLPAGDLDHRLICGVRYSWHVGRVYRYLTQDPVELAKEYARFCKDSRPTKFNAAVIKRIEEALDLRQIDPFNAHKARRQP